MIAILVAGALFIVWLAGRDGYERGYWRGRIDANDAARLEVRRANDAEWEALQERARKRGREARDDRD